MTSGSSLEPHSSADAALRRILLAELTHLNRWRKTAIKHSDPEAIHQLRVSLRRMRSVLELCRPLLPRQYGKQLPARLGRDARKLDERRDLDVLLLQQQLLRPLAESRPSAHQLMTQRQVLANQLKQDLEADMGRLRASTPPRA